MEHIKILQKKGLRGERNVEITIRDCQSIEDYKEQNSRLIELLKTLADERNVLFRYLQKIEDLTNNTLRIIGK